MLRKAIGATFMLLLMTQVISAQQDSGSNPFRPGLHLKDDKPSRTKEQKEYDKAIDGEYQLKLKEIPDAAKRPLGEYPSNSTSRNEEQAAMNARRDRVEVGPAKACRNASIVVQYIDGQPTRMNDDFRRLVLEALQAAWPCKK